MSCLSWLWETNLLCMEEGQFFPFFRMIFCWQCDQWDDSGLPVTSSLWAELKISCHSITFLLDLTALSNSFLLKKRENVLPLHQPWSGISKRVQCKQTVLTVLSSPTQGHSFAYLGTTVSTQSLLHFPAHIFSTPGSRQTLRCLLTATDHWSMSLTETESTGGCAPKGGSARDKALIAMMKKTSAMFQKILKEQRPKNLFYKEKYEIQCHQP